MVWLIKNVDVFYVTTHVTNRNSTNPSQIIILFPSKHVKYKLPTSLAALDKSTKTLRTSFTYAAGKLCCTILQLFLINWENKVCCPLPSVACNWKYWSKPNNKSNIGSTLETIAQPLTVHFKTTICLLRSNFNKHELFYVTLTYLF